MGKLPSEILDAAADLITPEGAWTQGAWVRGKSGRDLVLYSPRAVAFSILGALDRIGGTAGHFNATVGYVKQVVGNIHLQAWNDTPARTQSEVIQALRGAAAKAREAGQ